MKGTLTFNTTIVLLMSASAASAPDRGHCGRCFHEKAATSQGIMTVGRAEKEMASDRNAALQEPEALLPSIIANT